MIQKSSLAVNPIEGDHMRQLGRYKVRVRMLLFIPAFLAISWWITVCALDGETYQQLAALHETEALYYQVIADSPIKYYTTGYALGLDRGCRRFEIALSEAEIMKARRARDRAGRHAAHHQTLERKYAWATSYPWLLLATDPPEPE